MKAVDQKNRPARKQNAHKIVGTDLQSLQGLIGQSATQTIVAAQNEQSIEENTMTNATLPAAAVVDQLNAIDEQETAFVEPAQPELVNARVTGTIVRREWKALEGTSQVLKSSDFLVDNFDIEYPFNMGELDLVQRAILAQATLEQRKTFQLSWKSGSDQRGRALATDIRIVGGDGEYIIREFDRSTQVGDAALPLVSLANVLGEPIDGYEFLVSSEADISANWPQYVVIGLKNALKNYADALSRRDAALPKIAKTLEVLGEYLKRLHVRVDYDLSAADGSVRFSVTHLLFAGEEVEIRARIGGVVHGGTDFNLHLRDRMTQAISQARKFAAPYGVSKSGRRMPKPVR